MKAFATSIVLALLVSAVGCASNSEVSERTAESRLTEYQTVLNTYEKETADDSRADQLLAEAESLIRRAETTLSSDDSDAEMVDLYLDAAEAKLVEISTLKSLNESTRRSNEIESAYTERARRISELREMNEQELPPAGDNE